MVLLTSLIKKLGETSKTSFRFNNEPGKMEKFVNGHCCMCFHSMQHKNGKVSTTLE